MLTGFRIGILLSEATTKQSAHSVTLSFRNVWRIRPAMFSRLGERRRTSRNPQCEPAANFRKSEKSISLEALRPTGSSCGQVPAGPDAPHRAFLSLRGIGGALSLFSAEQQFGTSKRGFGAERFPDSRPNAFQVSMQLTKPRFYLLAFSESSFGPRAWHSPIRIYTPGSAVQLRIPHGAPKRTHFGTDATTPLRVFTTSLSKRGLRQR